MDKVELKPRGQHRASFRTSFLPGEVEVFRLWVHEPNIGFVDSPLGPARHVLLLENGIDLADMSGGGALLRIVTPPEIALMHLVTQPVPEPVGHSGKRVQAPYRDITFIMRLDLRKDLRDILVSGKIVRAGLVRTTSKASIYDIALRFYTWANVTGAQVQWYKVRDGSVPPVSTWITKRQLSRPR